MNKRCSFILALQTPFSLHPRYALLNEDEWGINVLERGVPQTSEYLSLSIIARNDLSSGVTNAFLRHPRFRYTQSQVGKGISAQTSHRTVRETLASYGSCHTNYIQL
jgi:hypothetical protein